jgi:plastocyanin
MIELTWQTLGGSFMSVGSLVLRVGLLTLLLSPSLRASEIEGTINIQRKLTKRKVTSSADAYQRGAAIELHSDKDQDPLAFERSHVVVYLEGNLPSDRVTAELNQQDRRFAPDLVVIPAGSSVSFANLDPVFHNVFSLSQAKSFDLGNYPKGQARTVTFPKPGVVFVDCHLHSNMSAVIVVTPNRWSVKVDPSGHFSLSGVRPGTYTIVAWHRAAGFFRKTIHVTETGVTTIDFAIPLDAQGGLIEQARQ